MIEGYKRQLCHSIQTHYSLITSRVHWGRYITKQLKSEIFIVKLDSYVDLMKSLGALHGAPLFRHLRSYKLGCAN